MNDSGVKQKVVQVIDDYMGAVAARMYDDFYKDKDDEHILISVRELLIEYFGDSPANKILKDRGLTLL